MALSAALFTWPLLFVGGLVTTYRVGMSVPDWPTTFGINMFLFDMYNTSWGVRIEHVHRLAGAAVGFFTIFLMLDFLFFGKGWKIKAGGVLALLAVIAQGVLGGIRVRQNSTWLAAVHGCTGQLFFAYLLFLVVVTGRAWKAPSTLFEGSKGLRFRAVWMLCLIYGQVVAGAWLRHFPSFPSLTVHAVLALAVAAHVVAAVVQVERDRVRFASLVPSARVLLAALSLQLVLGVAAWWVLRPFNGVARDVSILQALFRTGHQANAALLLGAAVVFAARSVRGFASSAVSPVTAPLAASSTPWGREALA